MPERERDREKAFARARESESWLHAPNHVLLTHKHNPHQEFNLQHKHSTMATALIAWNHTVFVEESVRGRGRERERKRGSERKRDTGTAHRPLLRPHANLHPAFMEAGARERVKEREREGAREKERERARERLHAPDHVLLTHEHNPHSERNQSQYLAKSSLLPVNQNKTQTLQEQNKS